MGASLISAHWRGLRISSSQSELPCGTWNLLRPEMEPVSPAFAGGLNLWTIRKSQEVLFSSHFSNQQPEDVFFFKLYNIVLVLPYTMSQLVLASAQIPITAPPTPIFPAALASPPPVSPAYLPTASLVCTLSFKRTRPFLLWPL